MFRKIINKFVVMVLILVFVSSVFLPFRSANAFIVFDPHAAAQRIAGWAKELARWVKEDMMKSLRDMVVDRIVDKITDDIVKSIQNGGDPSYVGNWKDYLGDAGNIMFNQLNEELKTIGPDLCSPIVPNLQATLYYRLNNPYGDLPKSCNFQDFKNNIQNSANYVEEGGWLAYDEMFVTSNNRYGIKLLVQDKYNADVASEKESRKNDAVSSSGFLSIKKCRKLGGGYTEETIKADCTDEAGKVDNACVRRVKEEWCEQWDTITPGNSVAESVTTALNLKGRYVTNVQSILSALVNVLITKVLDEAKGGLAGASSSEDPGTTYGAPNGTQDEVDNLNSSSVRDIQKGYNDVIDYLNNDILPLINNNISSLADGTCNPNDTITYEDNSIGELPPSNTTTLTVSGLNSFLLTSKNGNQNALNDAQDNLLIVNDYMTNPSDGSVRLDIISDYQDFVQTYSSIIADVGLINSGGTGDMEILYTNILSAINNTCYVGY